MGRGLIVTRGLSLWGCLSVPRSLQLDSTLPPDWGIPENKAEVTKSFMESQWSHKPALIHCGKEGNRSEYQSARILGATAEASYRGSPSEPQWFISLLPRDVTSPSGRESNFCLPSPCDLVRLPTTLLRPPHIMEGNLLCSVYQFKMFCFLVFQLY